MNNDLAKLIRKHRKARRLSQSQLAEAAGVGKTVVFDIEHSKPTVQMDTVLKILGALDIRLSFDAPPVPVNASRKVRRAAAPADVDQSQPLEEKNFLPAHLL